MFPFARPFWGYPIFDPTQGLSAQDTRRRSSMDLVKAMGRLNEAKAALRVGCEASATLSCRRFVKGSQKGNQKGQLFFFFCGGGKDAPVWLSTCLKLHGSSKHARGNIILGWQRRHIQFLGSTTLLSFPFAGPCFLRVCGNLYQFRECRKLIF